VRELITVGRVHLVEQRVTRENVVAIIPEADLRSIDVLSVDVDQNTYWIWDALTVVRPKVAVVEYNAIWPPPIDWVVPYDPDANWDGESFTWGASLGAYERLGRASGYHLVACDLTGLNAFFVRDDLITDRFVGPFTADALYHPRDSAFNQRLKGDQPKISAFLGQVTR
jgi:hypothetical protein